jgi:hypothetical protein
MASEGPSTVTKINGNDYEVRATTQPTTSRASIDVFVFHRVYDRKLSQSSGAGRGTKDAEDVTMADAPGARDAPGAEDQHPERRRQAVRAPAYSRFCVVSLGAQ